jgi:uncharacterized oxidoreductase
MKLEGKRILVTGGGSGIGLELARRLAGRNEVVIAGRDLGKLQRARDETPGLRSLGLDVTSEEEGVRAIAWLSAELGGLDLLVNNAGSFRGYLLSSPEAETHASEDVAVNVDGVLRMTRLALPLLEASTESAVLFVSSAVALAAAPGFSVYSATKAAVHAFARSLRAELADSHVRVFEVLPPVVDTAQARDLDIPKLAPAAVADAIIAGLAHDRTEIRVGRVRQLAPLARFMPSVADRILTRTLTPHGFEARARR